MELAQMKQFSSRVHSCSPTILRHCGQSKTFLLATMTCQSTSFNWHSKFVVHSRQTANPRLLETRRLNRAGVLLTALSVRRRSSSRLCSSRTILPLLPINDFRLGRSRLGRPELFRSRLSSFTRRSFESSGVDYVQLETVSVPSVLEPLRTEIFDLFHFLSNIFDDYTVTELLSFTFFSVILGTILAYVAHELKDLAREDSPPELEENHYPVNPGGEETSSAPPEENNNTDAADKWLNPSKPSPFSITVFARCPSFSSSAGHKYLRTGMSEQDSRLKKAEFQRKCVPAPDGGTVALDWPLHLDLAGNEELENVLLIVCGTTEGSDEYGVGKFSQFAAQRGYFPVVLNPRGCGGSPLTTPRVFSAADSDDVGLAAHFLAMSRPWATIVGIGWGFGANMLVKYLGDEASATPLIAAVCVDTPFDLNEATQAKSGSRWLAHDRAMANGLVKILGSNKMVFQGEKKGFDVGRALAANSVRDFDSTISCGVHGYKTVEEFYKQTSSGVSLGRVQIPLLCIQHMEDYAGPLQLSTPHHVFDENAYTMLLVSRALAPEVCHPGAALEWTHAMSLEWLIAVEISLLKGRHPLLGDINSTIKRSVTEHQFNGASFGATGVSAAQSSDRKEVASSKTDEEISHHEAREQDKESSEDGAVASVCDGEIGVDAQSSGASVDRAEVQQREHDKESIEDSAVASKLPDGEIAVNSKSSGASADRLEVHQREHDKESSEDSAVASKVPDGEIAVNSKSSGASADRLEVHQREHDKESSEDSAVASKVPDGEIAVNSKSSGASADRLEVHQREHDKESSEDSAVASKVPGGEIAENSKSSGASVDRPEVHQQVAGEEVQELEEAERGQVLSIAESVMKVLDVTMPGTLAADKKQQVLAAVGRGETLVTALEGAVPEDVREKMSGAVSEVVRAQNLSLKGIDFANQAPALNLSRVTESIQGNLSAFTAKKDPPSSGQEVAMSSAMKSDKMAPPQDGKPPVKEPKDVQLHADAPSSTPPGPQSDAPSTEGSGGSLSSPSPQTPDSGPPSKEALDAAPSPPPNSPETSQSNAPDKSSPPPPATPPPDASSPPPPSPQTSQSNAPDKSAPPPSRPPPPGTQPPATPPPATPAPATPPPATPPPSTAPPATPPPATPPPGSPPPATPPPATPPPGSPPPATAPPATPPPATPPPGSPTPATAPPATPPPSTPPPATPPPATPPPGSPPPGSPPPATAPPATPPPSTPPPGSPPPATPPPGSPPPATAPPATPPPATPPPATPPPATPPPGPPQLPSVGDALQTLTGFDDSTQMAVTNVFGVVENMLDQMEKDKPSSGAQEAESPANQNSQGADGGLHTGSLASAGATSKPDHPGPDPDSSEAENEKGGSSKENEEEPTLAEGRDENALQNSTKKNHTQTLNGTSNNNNRFSSVQHPADKEEAKLGNGWSRAALDQGGANIILAQNEHGYILQSDSCSFQEENSAATLEDFDSTDSSENMAERRLKVMAADMDAEDANTTESLSAGNLNSEDGSETNVESDDRSSAVKDLVLNALKLEVVRRLGSAGLEALGVDVELELGKIAQAVSGAVTTSKEDLFGAATNELTSTAEADMGGKLGVLNAKSIVTALGSVLGSNSLLGSLLPVGVLVGVVMAALGAVYLIVSDDQDEEYAQIERNASHNEHQTSESTSQRSRSVKKGTDPVSRNSRQVGSPDEQGHDMNDHARNGVARETTGQEHKETDDKVSGSKENISDTQENRTEDSAESESPHQGKLVGAMAAAMGATAAVASQSQANTAVNVGESSQGSQESGMQLVPGIAEKALSVVAPVVPKTEGGEVDQERAVAMLTEVGQKGGLLTLVGKVAMLWGGLRGAMSLADRLIGFFHVAERPLLQRLLGFGGMSIILWTPVLVPLLPTLLQQWATNSPSGVADAAAGIGLYGALFILVTIWGKRVRGYDRPLVSYGLQMFSFAKLRIFAGGLGIGLSLVTGFYTINWALGYAEPTWNAVLVENPAFPGVLAITVSTSWKVFSIVGQSFTTSLAVALVEEVLFRAWLQEEIAVDLGYDWAILLSALGFAVAQWSPPAILGNLFLAVALSGARAKTQGDLSFPVGIHTGIFTAFSVVTLGGLVHYLPDAPTWITGVYAGNPLAGALGTGMVAALALALYPRGQEEVPDED